VISMNAAGRIMATAGLAAALGLPAVARPDPVAPSSEAATNGPAATVRWKKPKDGLPVAEVQGLDATQLRTLASGERPLAEWQRILSIYSGKRGEPRRDLPQVAGGYAVTNGVLRFRMAFPLRMGIEYRAEFHPAAVVPGMQDTVSFDRLYVLPEKSMEKAATVVTAVYPSTAVLPENLLKFYLHFSAPMSRGDVYRHIRLLDASNNAVELPFLELDEELWNPEMTRLTLLLDPGRIKRGVRPQDEVGPALEAGKSYRLVISPEWRDSDGRPLKSGFTKPFTVGPADRETPDPTTWKLEAPAAGARTPLRVTIPEPLDQALASRLLQVIDSSSRPVEGTATLGDSERRWVFIPDRPWPPGNYWLRIPATIEDLAGNNIGKPFDVDLLERDPHRTTGPVVTLPFAAR